MVIAAALSSIPLCVRDALAPIIRELQALNDEIAVSDRAIIELVKTDANARRLMSVPGIGPIMRPVRGKAWTTRVVFDSLARALEWGRAWRGVGSVKKLLHLEVLTLVVAAHWMICTT